MIRSILFCLALVFSSNGLLAADGEDDAPESDVGLSAESAPEKGGSEMPEVTFSLIKDEPVIDGIIDDAFWDQAIPFQLDMEFYPTRFAPAVVDTNAWVGVGKSHIYVAFEAFDPKLEEMRSALREHDATKNDDYVSIIIDPTGTLAKKYEFRVNPHGSLSDVLQDTISDRYIYDWDTDWEGAAQINDNGYTVEIAIPFGSIRSPEKAEGQDHKGAVILKRSYPRRVDRTLGAFFLYTQHLEKTATTATVTPQDSGVQKSTEITAASVGVEARSIAVGATDAQAQPGSSTGSTTELDAGTEEDQKLTVDTRLHYIYHLDEKRSIGGSYEQVDEHNLHEVGIDLDIHFRPEYQ